MERYDAIIIGAGLAGLVATIEIAEAGKRVLLLDQEPEASLGGQAWWSFGGLFLIDSPEQRRLGVRDSEELAWQDWVGSAGFDRLEGADGEDRFGYEWAKAYVHFAASEKRQWLRSLGIRFFPVVGWAERGGSLAHGHGNSVPRFHIVWGTGPAILAPFIKMMRSYQESGKVIYRPRHRVDHLIMSDNHVTGVEGLVLAESSAVRGEASNRDEQEPFQYNAAHVLIASGGIGAILELIQKNWPVRLGPPPKQMISGVPAHVDGRMLGVAEASGARLVNRDRMWHYTEGIQNWNPVWENHGIRILPGPSSIWLNAKGERFHAPNMPGFDTLSTLKAIQKTGYSHSWFILTQKMIEKEFALSGSEQNPDLTEKSLKQLAKRLLPGAPAPVQAFINHGKDFLIAHSLSSLVHKMNAMGEGPWLDETAIRQQIMARDNELDNRFAKDQQITAIHGARRYIGDRFVRVAKPHKLLDPKNGPLIAVKLHLVSRKTLGGLQTDLSARVLNHVGQPITGLYAAGEASGFGGGGVHGYRALEGTFLGGCLFSGRIAGKAIACE